MKREEPPLAQNRQCMMLGESEELGDELQLGELLGLLDGPVPIDITPPTLPCTWESSAFVGIGCSGGGTQAHKRFKKPTRRRFMSVEEVGRSGSKHLGSSGVSRAPISRTTTAEEKRQQRLARNRESARQSRRRKKQYLELLHEKVSQLTTEIDGLRRAHFARAEQRFREQRRAFLESLEARSAACEAARVDFGRSEGVGSNDFRVDASAQKEARSQSMALRSTLEEALSARFGAWTQERRAVSAFYFKELKALLLPPYVRFLLWIMEQGEPCYSGKTDGCVMTDATLQSRGTSCISPESSGIFALFSCELGLTPGQARSAPLLVAKYTQTYLFIMWSPPSHLLTFIRESTTRTAK